MKTKPEQALAQKSNEIGRYKRHGNQRIAPLKAGSLFALFLKTGRPARHGHAAFHPAITSKPENIRNSAEEKPFGAIPIPVIRLFGSALVQEFLQFFKPFVKGDAVCHDQIVLFGEDLVNLARFGVQRVFYDDGVKFR